MASDSEPKPVPPGGTADPNQKHVSGMLVMSIVLSFSGFLILPLIGQVTGLLLGWLGRRRVRANPQLIGPRLANWAIGIAVIALAAQGVLFYRSYPGMAYVREVSVTATGFLENVRKGDYEAAYGDLSPAWQAEHSVEDVKAKVEAAFPAGEKIEAPKEQVEFRKDFSLTDFEKKITDWLGEDYPTETSYVLPVVLTGDKGRKVGLDLSLHSRRTGYTTFEVELTDFALEVLEVPEEKPASGAAADGNGAAGAAPEENGAATDEGTEKKTPEGEKPDEPR